MRNLLLLGVFTLSGCAAEQTESRMEQCHDLVIDNERCEIHASPDSAVIEVVCHKSGVRAIMPKDNMRTINRGCLE